MRTVAQENAGAKYKRSLKGRAAEDRYRRSPKGQVAVARYIHSPKGEEANTRYYQSLEAKIKRDEYEQSLGGRAKRAEYKQSPEGKAKDARYARSLKGKVKYARQSSKRRYRSTNPDMFAARIEYMHFMQESCSDCKRLYSISFQMDHIIALCNGGNDDWDNLQPLCIKCHRKKTKRDLEIFRRRI